MRLKDKPYVSITDSCDSLFEQISKNDFLSPNNLDLGIENGIAGAGLTLLAELDRDDSWTSLFPNDFMPVKNESLPV